MPISNLRNSRVSSFDEKLTQSPNSTYKLNEEKARQNSLINIDKKVRFTQGKTSDFEKKTTVYENEEDFSDKIQQKNKNES